jgi:hypothetical protein
VSNRFCSSRRPEGTMPPTLIIDADDTLWENNIHYEEAIDRF